jgi:hypothetical protein
MKYGTPTAKATITTPIRTPPHAQPHSRLFRITEREVQAQVAMYPDEGGEVIRPAWNRDQLQTPTGT